MRIIDMPEFKDKSQVLTFDGGKPIIDAVKVMAEKNYGAVLVTTKGKLAGIFTERDLMRRVAADGLDMKKKKLKDVMSKNVKTAKTTDKVADCMRRMSQGRFRHMPVLDAKGKVKGMLSQGDFVAITMPEILARARDSAKAGIHAGNSTPFSIMLAIVIYTLGLLFILSGFDFWAAGGP